MTQVERSGFGDAAVQTITLAFAAPLALAALEPVPAAAQSAGPLPACEWCGTAEAPAER